MNGFLFYVSDHTVETEPLHFEPFERVRITGANSALDEVRGKLAVVLSFNSEERCYAVGIYSSEQCWLVAEDALTWTGIWDQDEDARPTKFYPGGAVLISQDGRGEKHFPPSPRLGST